MMTLLARLPASPLSPNGRLERLLLGLGGTFMALNLFMLTLVRGFRPGDWLMLATWCLGVAVSIWVLERWLPNRDPILFSLAMFLTGWGLVAIDRLTDGFVYNFADRQTVWMVIGIALMLVIAVRPEPLQWLREYRYLMLLFGLLLLIFTIVLGTNPSGNPLAPQLWLGFGSVYFQPSELLKIVLVAFLASYLAEQQPALRAVNVGRGNLAALSPRIVGPVLLMWGLALVLLVWQRDLGAAALFFGVFLVLMYIASNNIWVLAGGSTLLLVAGTAAYNLSTRVRLRVDIWLNPWADADGAAYQIVQSLMAFAAGGVFGRGIGRGVAQSYIPVVHSDFILAAIAEEWGFLGVMVILACILTLVMRGMRVAVLQQERPFYALLAMGLSLLIAIQTLLITGGNLRVLPLTGVTLPFVSYGGSSLVASFMMIGLLLRLSASKATL